MFAADRVFSQRNGKTGLVEWFFNAREGVFGPYNSKEIATKTLHEFVEKCKAAYDDGGRGSQSTVAEKRQAAHDEGDGQPALVLSLLEASALSLETKQYDAASLQYDPLKRKKGKDG